MEDPVLPRHVIERFERRWALQNPLGLGRTYQSLTSPLEIEPMIPRATPITPGSNASTPRLNA
jgi:hypothetical protein